MNSKTVDYNKHNDVVEILKKDYGWKWSFYQKYPDSTAYCLMNDTIEIFESIDKKNYHIDKVYHILKTKHGWDFYDGLSSKGFKFVKDVIEVYSTLKRKSKDRPNLFWRLVSAFFLLIGQDNKSFYIWYDHCKK